MAPFSAIFDPVRRVLQVGHSDRAVVGGVRYLDIVFPLPTLARNRLGSNGSFPLRYIAGPPDHEGHPGAPRSYETSREGNVKHTVVLLFPPSHSTCPPSCWASLRPTGRRPRNPCVEDRCRGSAARTATAPAHLLMTGLILDSLPEEPRHQPCWFANCAPVGMACR